MNNSPSSTSPSLTTTRTLYQHTPEKDLLTVERSVLENRLRSAEEKLGFILESLQDYALLITDPQGLITNWSAGAERIFGYAENEIVGKPLNLLFIPEDASAGVLEKELQRALSTGRGPDDRWLRRKDGTLFWASGYVRPLFNTEKKLEGFAKLIRELTETKRAEERILELNRDLECRVEERTAELAQANKALQEEFTQRSGAEHQLLESSKLEAIGRLAGAVAHDFNNLITGILGITEELYQQSESPRYREDLAEVIKASQKAATLTRQLLAFGRRQIVSPKVLQLNGLITSMLNFYQRLLREDISLVTQLDPGLGNIKADVGQLEQVINNLVLNARDAMPNGGVIEIKTANVVLDETYVKRHFSVEPGPYVMLSIADTGHGMDTATLQHMFEPFFTTKTPGTGTGLGLATVYGILKQSGGDIAVYSEPGVGTTFRVYFPHVAEAVTEIIDESAVRSADGTETILVVEDEDLVRLVATRTLERRGYKVLQASDGEEAITFVQNYPDTIDLLLTDVVMPGMNGRVLADTLQAQRPTLAVLFMSGHPQDIIVSRGILHRNIAFIEKSFSTEALGHKVREILDQRKNIQGAS